MAVLTVRDCEIAYDLLRPEPETGPAIVWGHGLTSSRAGEEAAGLLRWDRIAEGNALLRYDSRGHGESESTPGGYGWDQLAQDQLELSEALGIERYIAGGASLGMATALHAAVAAPDRIEKLICMIPPTAWESRSAQADRYELMASIVETKGVEPLIAAAADMPVADPFVEVEAMVKDRQAEAMRAVDPHRLATVFRGATGANFPSPERVAELQMPVQILAWTGDDGHPISTVDRLVDLLPQAEVAIASTLDDVFGWSDIVHDFVHA